ncbi:T9SS type A sorting domain-containing protein [Tamlana sp. s12]|uniref:T9SS type A sorting domain-containing protein n=1 Tax=Tamlana sp. s12 TaxID=1630406 RepID=UPI00192CBBC5|nr:T9SS type A sorting domain-containing protein [Tamlana sp. s12]QQY83281.1 T9SS type A sorting domain-containing protein [Tamlana sp. s12]
MKTTHYIFTTLALTSLSLFGQDPVNSFNPSDTWTLLPEYTDEFNATTINWTKWSKTNNLPNVAAWKWNNDTNVLPTSYQGEQAASITARQNTGNTPVDGTYFNTGCLQSTNVLPTGFVGYVEARIWGADLEAPLASGIDKRRGVCPAFWLYSEFYDDKPVGEVIYTEIDVVELQQFDYYNGVQDLIYDAESNLHLATKVATGNGRNFIRPKQNPDAQLNKYELPGRFDPAKGWHTYGCEITPDKIHFYIDGIKVGKSLDNTHWSKNPLQVIVSLGMRVPFVTFSGNAFVPVNPEEDGRASKNLPAMPVSMYLDYLRVWSKDNALSVSDSKQSKLKAFPNPTEDYLYLKDTQNAEITIFNSLGQSVFQKQLENHTKPIDVRHLLPGIYFIKTNHNNQIKTGKFIKK